MFPSLRVVDFLDRVFDYLNFTYTSEFISGTGSWLANDLYMLYPAFLSTNEANKRNAFLFPHPYNVPINQDQELDEVSLVDSNGQTIILSKNKITNYLLTEAETYEPHGPTNYAFPAVETKYDYGFQYRTSTGVADFGSENIGYIAYGSAFDAKVDWSGGGSVTILSLIHI